MIQKLEHIFFPVSSSILEQNPFQTFLPTQKDSFVEKQKQKRNLLAGQW